MWIGKPPKIVRGEDMDTSDRIEEILSENDERHSDMRSRNFELLTNGNEGHQLTAIGLMLQGILHELRMMNSEMYYSMAKSQAIAEVNEAA
jgi:hypothetical protein